MRVRAIMFMLCGFAILFGGTGFAQTSDSHCDDEVGERRPTTPDDQFINLGNGIIEHRESSLQWSRCALGQNLNGSRCTGRATVFSWQEAKNAVQEVNRRGEIGGRTDWRLPTVEELMTLVERCREAPSINSTIFPDTPWSGFWTSTLHFDGRDRVDDYEPEHVDVDALEGAHKDDDPEEREERKRPLEAWFVGFYKGLEYPYNVDSAYRVRVVRSP
ncbi:MAG: DUF1566 domain-containing protein [Wenzhouxiangellaceae bacterium]